MTRHHTSAFGLLWAGCHNWCRHLCPCRHHGFPGRDCRHAAGRSCTAPKKCLKEIAEALGIVRFTRRKGEFVVPSRRWLIAPAAGWFLAQLVIGCALIRVFQNVVGFVYFFKPGFRCSIGVDVGMIHVRAFAERLFDVIHADCSGHAKHLVIALVYHSLAFND
jgi:hypothetical protein